MFKNILRYTVPLKCKKIRWVSQSLSKWYYRHGRTGNHSGGNYISFTGYLIAKILANFFLFEEVKVANIALSFLSLLVVPDIEMLKVPKCEIFSILDSRYFYTPQSLNGYATLGLIIAILLQVVQPWILTSGTCESAYSLSSKTDHGWVTLWKDLTNGISILN